MRVFLTGATGFIGRGLALRLLRDHHRVTAWVRDVGRARQALGADVLLVAASDDDGPLDAAIADADVVIHLAGEPIIGKRWSDAHKRVLRDSRVELSARITRAFARAPTPPQTLLTTSAVGYYGDRGDAPLSEESPPGTGFLSELCVAWERATDPVEAQGVRRVRLRVSVVLGPEGGALEKMLTPFRMGVGGRLGPGTQWMPWIHLEDALEVFAQAATDPRYAGAINVVAPEAVTNMGFTEALGRALHRPAVVPVPAIALKVALGEAACAVLDSQRVEPRALTALGFRFRYPALDAALQSIVTPSSSVSVGPAGSPPSNDYTSRRTPRYLLSQDTLIDAPVDEVFAFFSRAENLGALTPPQLAFAIQTPLPLAMADGTTIDYRIALGPLPLRWRTVIHQWTPGRRFADAQERGPYAAWWHEHVFEARGDQTWMEDRVYYAPPLGPLGGLANALAIRGMLTRIFSYRSFAMRLRFG